MSRTVPITTFAREYSTLLEEHPNDDLVLERRAGKESLLVRPLRRTESDQHAVGAVAHVLAALLERGSGIAVAVAEALDEEYPWVTFLPPEVRQDFRCELLRVLRACSALGRFGPFEDFVQSWRATAEIYAEPQLARELQRPIETPDGRDVPLSAAS